MNLRDIFEDYVVPELKVIAFILYTLFAALSFGIFLGCIVWLIKYS